VGELNAEFASAVERDRRLFAAVVRAILDANFPDTLHQDILDAVGIALAPDELATTEGRATTRRRDPRFRELVLLAYEYRCAACGYDGQLGREAVGIDAAHVRWWAADGPDEVANGVALCSLHHKLFDRGAVGLTLDHHLSVSSHFVGRSAAADDLVMALIGRPLLAPQAGRSLPDGHHVGWHTREVFRTPARQLA
jgi:putative restriction endonuclease